MDAGREDRSWRLWAGGAVVGLLALGVALALLVLPAMQRGETGLDLWASICRAVGLGHASPAYAGAGPGGAPVSEVAWGAATLDILARADAHDGEMVASQTCSSCHGDAGVSTSALFPVLAGQSAEAIFKQLRDYKSGARSNPAMAPALATLTQQQMADVAAYYAQVQDPAGLGRRYPSGDPQALRLAIDGDPARNLPACNACHGAGANVGGPVETPALSGQKEEYLERQLDLFASGERRNDLYGRMRSISRALTDDEKARVADYYQGLR